MLFGHDAVARVFGDAAALSNGIMQRIYDDSFGYSINGMDAPDHPRYRRLFQKAFMPNVVNSWGNELVPRVVNGIIDDFAGHGKAELVKTFTERYPFEVIYGQLQMPADECALFHRLAVGLMCITVNDGSKLTHLSAISSV